MDSAGQLLHDAHHLYHRSGGMGGDTSSRPPAYKIVGIILAISSGLFIGVSFVLKKHGLLKANEKYNEAAGDGYGYLKNFWWWSGMTLMIIGEICNFVAYAFVDAILVTPMGALTVVVAAILSAIFLKERLSFVGKIGCVNCIIGSIIIALNAPQQSAVSNIQDMKKLVIAPGFLVYGGVVIVASVVIALWLGPKYGKKSMMVYLTICSLIGGLSVVATQGLGAAIIAQINGQSQFKEWFLYVLLVFVISTLLTEIIYLNKALNLFNAALVTPTYYVFFTSATIVTSAILFQGFKGTVISITTIIMGFLQICTGVVLLQLSKSAKDVPDAAVFKGDLDQVRTVAEQEEPEYEPRADTIRGGGAILRSISRARSEKQLQEVKKLHEEHMQPIGEGETVEFDGLRRRKTVLDPNRPPTRSATVVHKTVHPPLGMSHFPEDDSDSDNDTAYHPGFFQRLRSRGKSTSSSNHPRDMDLESLPPTTADSPSKNYMHTDTAYKPHDTTIQFGTLPHPPHPHDPDFEDAPGELHPPRPPPHIAKRQFSFQNVFSRKRSESGAGSSVTSRPVSRHSRKGSHNAKEATEEERLGLVKGDSRILGPIPSRDSREGSPPGYTDEEGEWVVGGRSMSPERAMSPGRGSSGGAQLRRVDTEEWDPEDDKEFETRKPSGPGAFI
ncbi:hypothetical protein DPSP01_000583 [Paraphaeosphaeria sporulosa]|uniref:DUF803-domain-containing protein n=1 Tax=Paraphaeosphaeria sporulosa TaxID=1460663 RepID=A0A177CA43_9PLEO|nr:DUF803-domain-containing protein [Paraphaeosphaeria sporulosa]OAG03699.1 DUF803-domain-containing protein [Paraphaeosphaeria sporulosa]